MLEKQIYEIEKRLSDLEKEKSVLLNELSRLRSTTFPEKETPILGLPALPSAPVTAPKKIDLFLKMFRCRDDVYPILWENKSKGTKGYSPACANEWVRGVCGKPKVKCSDCQNRSFLALDAVAVDAHLRGTATIGTYAIRADESCVFLACDFDGDGWQEDVKVYRNIARSFGVDVAVERSRSGAGAHAWVFFQMPLPARLARLLGTFILSKSSEYRPNMSLESFDRFFPNQDYLPKGGFGNLIALPLQKLPREQGSTCFLDQDLNVIPDQWGYLSQIRRVSLEELRSLVSAYLPSKQQTKTEDSFDDLSWIADQNALEVSDDSKKDGIAGLLNGPIELRLDSQLHIPLEGLPGKIVTRLKRTASFANPEFYKRQRMRMQTYPEPRFIFSGEIHPDEIILPRGTLDSVTKILAEAGAQVVVRDERLSRKRLKAIFKGELTPDQARSVKIIKSHDCGVLVAPPGAGKTVMGCALISERKVSTLILVHRQPLLEQWKDRLVEFLDINKKDIGTFGGTRKKRTGMIDIGMLQSIAKTQEIDEISSSYSQIIIDECHHIPAASFESVMKQIPARYIVGLTATPRRKDGLEKILYQQCGPVRHEMQTADEGRLTKTACIRQTGFRTPVELGDHPPYHLLIESLVSDERRNALISADVVTALRSSRFPLLISDRKEHMEQLERLIKEQASADTNLPDLRIIRIDGNLSAKQRRVALEEVGRAKEEGKPTLIIATASLIGEGFDMADLDTLVLSMPLSFEGRMIQYAGRLHRLSEEKLDVLIYDYLDSANAMLLKMYRNRLKAYRKMGYVIRQQVQGELVSVADCQ